MRFDDEKSIQRHKRISGIIGGSLLVIVGILLFLNTIGVISFSLWRGFATFWPVGLILIGLAMIFRMRNLTMAFIVLTIIFATIYASNIITDRMIIESGNITTREYNATGFNDIELDIPGELYVTQGDNYSVSIAADENIIDLVDAGTTGDTLHINYNNHEFWNLWSPSNIKVYITSPNISSIEVLGAGNIKGSNVIKSDSLKVSVSGAGNVELETEVKSLEVKISGFGNGDFKGSAEKSNFIISGAGNIKAYNLAVHDAKVTVSGTGNADMNATDTLDVIISGAGNVNYKGDPHVTEHISGAGNVKKVE